MMRMHIVEIIAIGFKSNSSIFLIFGPILEVRNPRKMNFVPWLRRVVIRNVKIFIWNTPDATENIP